MMSKFFNSILTIIFITLVALFVYKESNRPSAVSVPINQEVVPSGVFKIEDIQNIIEEHAKKQSIELDSLKKEDINKIVQDYIEKNPEEIIKSLENLQLKNQKKEADDLAKKSHSYLKDNSKALRESDNPPIMGNSDGDIKMVTFLDYNCSYCKKSYKVDEALLKSDKNIQIILRPLPILGEKSDYVVRVALSVWKISPHSFIDFHHDMMIEKKIDKEFLQKLLAKHSIDQKKIEETIQTDEINNMIARNFEFAKNIGMRGTPSYVINDQFIPGFLDLDKLKQVILAIRGQSTK